MMKRRILLLFVSIALILGLALPAVAAAPQENPGKAPSGLTKTVFVHYPRGFEAKGGIPGPPSGGGDDDGGKKEKLWYSYDGTHWLDTSVPYVIDVGNGASFEAAIIASFETWEATGAGIDFEDNPLVANLEYDVPSTLIPTPGYPDGTPNTKNEVGWASFELYGLPSNAIAVTAVWIYTGTKVIAEVDMIMNYDLGWSTDLAPNTFDVQNIVTHEVGHWLMLGDLYNRPAREQTMYGYGAINETKKQSLEGGDIAGILEIYPTQ